MQKHSKPGSLKDQDPKSKISKINFALWIRGFCRHSSHPFLKDQDPQIESRFNHKIMQIRCCMILGLNLDSVSDPDPSQKKDETNVYKSL